MIEHMEYHANDLCRNCWDEKEEKSVHHLLCDSPAYSEADCNVLTDKIFIIRSP